MICYDLAMEKQHLGPHVVVGYGIKIFWPGLFITSPDHLEHLNIYNFRSIVHFLKRILQVVDNAAFWQNVLLYFENDPLSPSF